MYVVQSGAGKHGQAQKTGCFCTCVCTREGILVLQRRESVQLQWKDNKVDSKGFQKVLFECQGS